MNSAHDPFAVGEYDPAKLPAVSASFLSSASMDVRLLHMLLDEEGAFEQPIEAYDFLATQVIAAYDEPGAWRILDPSLLFSPGEKSVSGGWEELADASVPVEPTDAQKQERRARLSAAIRLKAQNGEFPRAMVRRALAKALDLETKVRKRKDAARIAGIEGRYLARGESPEAALKMTAADAKRSVGKVRALRASPEYCARRDLHYACAAETGGRFVAEPHGADDWFAGNTPTERVSSADRVAAHLIGLMQVSMRGHSKKGKRPTMPPAHLRWDALNVVEGFAKRHIPLSATALLLVDHALGLYDCEGNPVAAPLGGMRKHAAFLAAAEYEGTEEGSDIYSVRDLHSELRSRGDPAASPKQLNVWRARETYQDISSSVRAGWDREWDDAAGG